MKKRRSDDDHDDDLERTIDEACYYLSRLGVDDEGIAKRFETSTREVARRRSRFSELIQDGDVAVGQADMNFWRDIKNEAEGNIRVTFVSDKGFHHAWRSDLTKLDGPTLLSIYESCRHFLDLDPSARFVEYSPPKNYDPLAMQREIKKALLTLGALLDEKWREQPAPSGGIT